MVARKAILLISAVFLAAIASYVADAAVRARFPGAAKKPVGVVTLSSATINSAGTTLTLAFSSAVSVSDAVGWSIEFDNYAERVLAYSSGSGTSSIVFSISANPTYTDAEADNDAAPVGTVATLDYSSGNITGLATITDRAVTNNSTVIPDPDIPSVVDTSLPANWNAAADYTPANAAALQVLLDGNGSGDATNGTSGDWTIIQLASDGTNFGPLTIDDSCQYIEIRTDAYASIPAYGTRLRATDDGNGFLALMSRAPVNVSDATLRMDKGSSAPGARHIRFIGIKFLSTGTMVSDLTSICAVGDGVDYTLTEAPTHIGFDRCLIEAENGIGPYNVIAFNVTDSFVIDSRFENLHGSGQDGSTGIWTYQGARNKYHNNYIQTESAAVFFGDNSRNTIEDMTVTNNFSTRDPTWNDANGLQKAGLIETKAGKRILIENNSCVNQTWADAFAGIMIKADGTGGPKSTSHVTCRYNKIIDGTDGIVLSVSGSSPDEDVGPNHDMLVDNCLVYGMNETYSLVIIGDPGVLSGGTRKLERVQVRHYTGIDKLTRVWFEGANYLKMFDNIIDVELSGLDNVQFVGAGAVALNACWNTTYNVQYDAFITESISAYDDDTSPTPTGTLDNNLFPVNIAAVGFANAAADDYRILSGTYFTASSTGGVIGCDVVELNTRLSGVEE
jgi:hypothetical protein